VSLVNKRTRLGTLQMHISSWIESNTVGKGKKDIVRNRVKKNWARSVLRVEGRNLAKSGGGVFIRFKRVGKMARRLSCAGRYQDVRTAGRRSAKQRDGLEN